ncbi:hypothetical protein SRHO_G00188560 [Serrasalmus rhombeus]
MSIDTRQDTGEGSGCAFTVRLRRETGTELTEVLEEAVRRRRRTEQPTILFSQSPVGTEELEQAAAAVSLRHTKAGFQDNSDC